MKFNLPPCGISLARENKHNDGVRHWGNLTADLQETRNVILNVYTETTTTQTLSNSYSFFFGEVAK